MEKLDKIVQVETQKEKEVEVSSGGITSTRKDSKKDGRV